MSEGKTVRATPVERLENGMHVVFYHEGVPYGGVVTEVSPGGYARVVGHGFVAENVSPAICTVNNQYEAITQSA